MADRRARAPRRPPEQLSILDEPGVVPRPHRPTPTRMPKLPPRGPRFGEQFEIFPARVQVERLDPRRVVGPRSRVAGLWRVTIGDGESHYVFEDRHGRYCEAHGVDCRAVREVAGVGRSD